MHSAIIRYTIVVAIHFAVLSVTGRIVSGADAGHSHHPISEEEIDESQIIDLDTLDTSDEGYDIRRLDQPGIRREGDAGPAQLFEIIRPDNGAVRIGRVAASCSCILFEPLRTSAAADEPLLLELRNVQPTPEGGQVYEIYVEILEPVVKVLRQFALVVSD